MLRSATDTPGPVILRDVVHEDLPVLFEHQLDPQAVAMAAFPSRGKVAFVSHWTKILADATILAKAIVVDGVVAGNLLCWGPAEERLIGYWIGREFWGRGVATEAVRRFLDEVPDRPLRANVAVDNVASIRVLEKCGFAVTGRGVADGVEELHMRLDGEPQGPPA
jgi:RimJ/RimL family protein N-acetyltransferase